MAITVAKAKDIGRVARWYRREVRVEGEELEVERSGSVEQLRPCAPENVLDETGDEPRSGNADEDETDRARDQPVSGRAFQTAVAFSQDEGKRNGYAGRNQHPIRFADIGDGSKELADLGGQRFRPLQNERIENQEPEQDKRDREHDLLDQSEILNPHSHSYRRDPSSDTAAYRPQVANLGRDKRACQAQ